MIVDNAVEPDAELVQDGRCVVAVQVQLHQVDGLGHVLNHCLACLKGQGESTLTRLRKSACRCIERNAYRRGDGVQVVALGLEVGAFLFGLEVQLYPSHYGVQRP